MNSQNDIEILNITPSSKGSSENKNIITTSRRNIISSDVQVTSPNSDSNFLSSENENKNIENEIKKDEKTNKRKINHIKPIVKYNTSKLVKNQEQEQEKNDNKNEEIYLYNKVNNNINNNIEQNQILNFIVTRLNKDKTLQCNILIKNNKYILYSNSQKFILSAQEVFSIFHKNFLIYTTRDFLENSVIAQLHSYLQKSEFILYDTGISPSKLKNNNIDENTKKKLRRYLLQIKFLNDKKFNHFIVYLPKENYFNNNIFNTNKNHSDKLNNGDFNKINLYENSLPKFDFSLHKFVDNYSSRVKEKSKFNFKIINEGQKSIECGKVNDCNYTLDISYPFSPLEAFAISLSFFIKNK